MNDNMIKNILILIVTFVRFAIIAFFVNELLKINSEIETEKLIFIVKSMFGYMIYRYFVRTIL